MGVKRLAPALLASLATFAAQQGAEACTIFVLTDAERVMFCNNEDWTNPKSRIWFVPASNGHLGCAYVGFDHGWAQGGMNTKGLAFDWVAGPVGTWKPIPDMKVVPGNPSERMLETCTTVEEAVDFFRKHREPSFGHAKILVADRSGKSVIVGARDGNLQVSESTQCRGFGYGQRTLDKRLAAASEPTVANGAGILRACLQNGKSGTKYSNIFDLKSGDIHLFQPGKLYDEVKLNLTSELMKGAHYYDISHINEQLAKAPKPLLNNMKRLFMDQFNPIADTEPGVTSRIRVILQDLLDGHPKAEDYTAEFLKKIKQGELQAIADFKFLGSIASLTLVDRMVEGTNRSHRYHIGFRGVMAMEVQLCFVFDQKNRIALVELEGIEYQ